uniref:ARAD1D00770p n=1 Tax=Blastobotrys adeninivorans TaxID=409370 RepID=A0A060T756_BLAAD
MTMDQTDSAAPNENIQAQGRLRQIKSSEDHRSLELIDAWYTIIPAQLSSKLLAHLKNVLPEDKHSLNHLRRLVKIDSENTSQVCLKVIVCTVDTVADKQQIVQFVRDALGDSLDNVTVDTAKIPRFQAYTKEQAAEWSSQSWPILWRGNPAAIKTALDDKEVDRIVHYLGVVSEMSKNADSSQLPVATIIVDPIRDRIVARQCDDRNGSGNPLAHSIMNAAVEAARVEAERRENGNAIENNNTNTNGNEDGNGNEEDKDGDDRNYLCLDMHVYTTHEPCVMCAMALIHSRIARLVYIHPSPKTGAIEPSSGAGTCVHWTKGLNWKYEAWRWLGPDYDVSLLSENVNA